MKVFLFALAFLLAPAAFGQAASNREAEVTAAFDAARATMTPGPSDIKIANQAVLHLPAGFVFVPTNEAVKLLKAMGNRPGMDVAGMIFPQSQEPGFVVVRYIASGYIKDDDAKEWNADDMLASFKEGTEASNAERKQRGFPEMEVVGWVERPAYDASSHRLVWSMALRDKGTSDSEQGVNYNTYLLGREGYVSMNLVTDLKAVESQKPTARQLLAALEFDKGKAYADFNSSTDRVAEYGLAALIGGVAAKKLGLFALIAAFAVKFAKVIALGVAALGTLLWKFLGKKKSAEPPTVS
jgi:uncharacterized membrane-anchored protein